MQLYKFKVKYEPGPSKITDPLSRLVGGNLKTSSSDSAEAEEYVRFVAINATPCAMTTREVEEASNTDEERCAVKECLNGKPWDQLAYKKYLPCSSELCSIGQLILRGTRIVIPKKLRPRVLSLAHEGHLGIVGTKQKLRSKVWWPGMEKDAEKHCKTCYGCQLVSRPSPPEPIRSTALPTGPWRDLAIDLLGPLPTGESILVVVDYYSRYYEIDIIRSTVASKVISSLEEIFASNGLPSPYTVVNKHGNSLIVQSPGGAQYSRNTSHVKKLLENGDTHDDTPSIPEVVVTGEPHKQDKLTPQQSVVIPEPNVVEPEVPLRRFLRHRVAPSYLKDYCT